MGSAQNMDTQQTSFLSQEPSEHRLTRFINASSGDIFSIMLRLSSGLGDSSIEAELRRGDHPGIWSGRLLLRSAVKSKPSESQLSESVAREWISRLSEIAPLISTIPKSTVRSIAVSCEISMNGTRVLVHAPGVDCATDDYQKVVKLAMDLVPSAATYVVRGGDDGPYGEGYWNFPAIEKKKSGVRDNPHTRSGKSAEIEIAGIRVALPLGHQWSEKKSIISRRLLKSADVIVARIGDLYFGMHSRTVSYGTESGKVYIGIIECIDDYSYFVDMICKEKRVYPTPVLLRGYRSTNSEGAAS